MLDRLRQPGEDRLIEQLGQRGQIFALVGGVDRLRGRGARDGVAPDARLDQRDDELQACHLTRQISWKVPVVPRSCAAARPTECPSSRSRCSSWLRARSFSLRRSRSYCLISVGRREPQSPLLRLQVALERHGGRLRRDLAHRARRSRASRGSASSARRRRCRGRSASPRAARPAPASADRAAPPAPRPAAPPRSRWREEASSPSPRSRCAARVSQRIGAPSPVRPQVLVPARRGHARAVAAAVGEPRVRPGNPGRLRP